MASNACKSAAKRLLKCFCGCSELTEEEVCHISRLSAQETLIDRQAVQLLRRYMELRRSGDKSKAEEMLDIYELCAEFLMLKGCVVTLDHLEMLDDLGLPFHMNKELKTEIQTGGRDNINRCLLRIQGECRNEIEGSGEYKGYKEAILDKLKNKEP